jgi:hypothetical protein
MTPLPTGDSVLLVEKDGGIEMGVSASLLLSAAGAVLIWAVNASTSGINLHTVGVILLIVGIVGFVISLFFWSSWGGFHGTGNRTTVTHEERPTHP